MTQPSIAFKEDHPDVYLEERQHFHTLYRKLHGSAALKWKDIGIFLDLDLAELDTIETKDSDIHSCLQRMLSLWLKKIDPCPTKSKIIGVLRELHFTEEAKKLEEELT